MNEFDDKIISSLEDKIVKFKDKNYLELFSTLEKQLKPKELIACYCYILKTKDDTKLLDITIRQINQKKYIDVLPSLIDFILKTSSDSSFLNVKVLAIKVVSNYKNKKALNALIFCLNDKNSNYRIRLAAAEAIGKIGDKNAYEHLEKIIQDDSEKSTYVKESAIVALGMLGDSRAIEVFSSIMNTKQIFEEKFSALKERIVEAISKFDVNKNNKALDILKTSLLDTSSQIRINAIEALMNLNIEGKYELIYDRLKYDSDIEVQKNALIALYNISDRKILDEIIEGQYCEELKNYARETIEEYEL